MYKKEIIDSPINDIRIENEYFGIPDEELYCVHDYLNPEISEKQKIKLIGRTSLRRVYRTLRKHGINPEVDIISLLDLNF